MVERVRRLLTRATVSAAMAIAIVSSARAQSVAPGAVAHPACTPNPDPSADLERTFREAVRAYRPPDGGSGEALSKSQMRFAAGEAERILVAHPDLLRQHVRWAL